MFDLPRYFDDFPKASASRARCVSGLVEEGVSRKRALSRVTRDAIYRSLYIQTRGLFANLQTPHRRAHVTPFCRSVLSELAYRFFAPLPCSLATLAAIRSCHAAG
jgi:hypothetical protein